MKKLFSFCLQSPVLLAVADSVLRSVGHYGTLVCSSGSWCCKRLRSTTACVGMQTIPTTKYEFSFLNMVTKSANCPLVPACAVNMVIRRLIPDHSLQIVRVRRVNSFDMYVYVQRGHMLGISGLCFTSFRNLWFKKPLSERSTFAY